MKSQPDIGQHASPAAVSINEWVNANRSIVQMHGLFEAIGPVQFPESQILDQLQEFDFDLVPDPGSVSPPDT